MTLEEMVREDLERAAGHTPDARGAPVEDVIARGRRRTRVKRTSLVTLVALVFVGVLALDLFPGAPPDVAGTEDQKVLRTDPLVIEGHPGPEPMFDTSQLGTRVELTPPEDLEGLPGLGAGAGDRLLRVVGLGTTPRGEVVSLAHSEGTSNSRRVQWRCVSTPGGSTCGGRYVDELPGGSDYITGLWLGPSAAVTVGGPGILHWDVYPETAVAMLTVNGERFWQRPIGGVAVFDTDLRAGDRLVYTQFDSDGRMLRSGAETAEGDPDDVPSFECPVTYPGVRFRAPEPWPAQPAHVGMAWYGSADLWTALTVDSHGGGGSKTVLWSAEFSGGAEEPEPALDISYRRLDVDQAPISNEGRATNAHTDEDGWFMIGGINPDEPGCWEVTATYKGATLSYVYEVRG